MNDSENPKSKVSRRTIVGAAAWSAPVIALSAASPAQAVSQPPAPKVPMVTITNAASISRAYLGSGNTVGYWDLTSQAPQYYVLTGVHIAATEDGKPATNDGSNLVTITVPAPLQFSDKSTTKTFTVSGNTTSVDLPGDAIEIPVGTAPGKFTINVEYRGVTDSVTVTVVEGASVIAWGVNNNGQAAGITGIGNHLSTPRRWDYSNDRKTPASAATATFTTYTSLTGSSQRLSAYTELFDDVATTGDGLRPFRRGLDAARLVNTSKGAWMDATFFWGKDGLLYATGKNNGDMFSLGDNSPADNGTDYARVAVGTKILEANPGKKIVEVFPAKNRAYYILDDKTVWSSGINVGGAMGNNDGVAGGRHVATQTVTAPGVPLTNIVSVSSGDDSSMFLDGSGNLWGAGTPGTRSGAVQIPGFTYRNVKFVATPVDQPESKPVKKIWGAAGTNFAQTTDDAVYFAGLNSGKGSNGSAQLSGGAWSRTTVASGKTVADLALNDSETLFLMTDGTLYFSGSNTNYGRGDGTTTGPVLTMVKVPITGTVIDFAITEGHTYAALVK